MDLAVSRMAARAETSTQYINQILAGKVGISVTTLGRLADALDCDLEIRLVPRQGTASRAAILDKRARLYRKKYASAGCNPPGSGLRAARRRFELPS